ncbi:MAG: TatD family hydrolase [Clostridia bacterium]|nr:TatD family hydrolase [Clostridia bacterium]
MSNIKYFDSHAHLHDSRYADCEWGDTNGMINAAREAGLVGAVNIGTNLEDAKRAIEFAERYPFIFAAVGMYPSEAQYAGSELDSHLSEIEKLLSHPKVVALGEIGLDYHYEDTDKSVQAYAFEAQMQMAERCNMPVVIHDRDAHGDTMDMIRKYPNIHGVLHSFSGSAEMARQLASLGWYISFSGPVTYKNAAKVKEAAQIVPDDKILVETDSPYLPPVPHRGKTNYPGYVAYTVRAIAQIRGKSEEEIAELTVNNAKRFFGITHL